VSAVNTPVGQVVGLDAYRKSADRCQAEYFRKLLDGQQAQVQHELTGHTATLARYQHVGDLNGVRRMRRLVRAKETELNTIGYLIRGLDLRFGSRRPAPRH
jgi:hypothetical protein